MSTEAATDKLRGLLHEIVCAIELGVLSHVDGSNESPHDGEHPHPWPCERMADGFRAKNLHLTAANWRRDGPHAFFLDPETGDEWPTNLDGIQAEAAQGAAPLDPKMCCEWADPIVSDSGLMCRSCDSPLLPASKGARIVKAFDRYGIRESEGATPRAEGLPYCQLCGANPVNEDHALETQRRWKALTSGAAPRAEGLDEAERLMRLMERDYRDGLTEPESEAMIRDIRAWLSRPSDERQEKDR